MNTNIMFRTNRYNSMPKYYVLPLNYLIPKIIRYKRMLYSFPTLFISPT